MLSPLLGEEIEVVVTTTASPWPVLIDPGQLEQLLINLAVNARDAMPQGGRLDFVAENVFLDETYRREHPDVSCGDYVRLVVRDSGTGIADDAQKHVFEPFYTTKPVGHGTGLGLATCHGIVRQRGGHIELHRDAVDPTIRTFSSTPDARKRVQPTRWDYLVTVRRPIVRRGDQGRPRRGVGPRPTGKAASRIPTAPTGTASKLGTFSSGKLVDIPQGARLRNKRNGVAVEAKSASVPAVSGSSPAVPVKAKRAPEKAPEKKKAAPAKKKAAPGKRG